MPPFLDRLSRLTRAARRGRPRQRYLAALRLAAPRRPGPEVLNAASSPAPALAVPGEYRVAVLLNVALGPGGRMVNFDGFEKGHELAVASPTEGSPLLILTVTAPGLLAATERVFAIGNRQDTDDKGVHWPRDPEAVKSNETIYCYLDC